MERKNNGKYTNKFEWTNKIYISQLKKIVDPKKQVTSKEGDSKVALLEGKTQFYLLCYI